MGEALFADRYRLLGPLGEGGAASTHRAFDEVRGEEVALKVLRADAPELEATLLRELELLGPLTHPSLVAVFDFGRARSSGALRPYYAARLVEGPRLVELARRGWAALAPVLLDVLDALAFLHRAGARHGDVKPDNVLVDEAGRGVLIDLGCAAPLGVASPLVSGTAGYLAPELLAGGVADARSDLFAFGKTVDALAALVGTPPDPWPRLAARCVAPRPEDRPVDVAEVLEALGHGDRALFGLPPESATLLGRSEELAEAKALLDVLMRGEPGPRVLALGGGPGSGRSRLLAELKRVAQPRCAVIEIAPQRSEGLSRWLGETRRGIEGVLEGVSRLRSQPRGPELWVLDDADALGAEDAARLAALAQTLEAQDPVLVLTVAEDLEGEAVKSLKLGPLDRDAVAAWAEGRLEPSQLDELYRLSAGHPGTVRWLLAGASSGRRALGDGEGPAVALDAETREGLLRFAAHASAMRIDEARAAGVTEAQIQRLAAEGWIRAEAGRVGLTRPADADAILRDVPAEARRAAHAALSAVFSSGAVAIRHRARAGDLAGAKALLRATSSREGAGWRDAARALVVAGAPVEGALLLAEEGALAEAVELLEGLGDAAPFEARLELGRCLLKLERAAEALTALDDALAHAPDAQGRGRVADAKARARIKLGDYDAARALAAGARDELERAEVEDPGLAGALAEDVGVAESYLGRESARAHLEEAARALETDGGPRDRVRVESYLAIDAYRRGELAAARRGYARALALVERHGLDEQLAHAALNLGTALHQGGAYAEAASAYRRAQRVARALGQRATDATLCFDLAQLYADIGAWDRALDAAGRAQALAEQGGFALLVGGCVMVRAQVALRRGGVGAAEALRDARAIFEGSGAARELDEVSAAEIELALLEGRPGDAERALAAPRPEPSADLAIRLSLLRGACAIQAGRGVEGRDALEAAARDADARGLVPLAAEAHARLADAWDSVGAARSAATHRAEAERRAERMAAGLSAGLADAFWEHPRRRSLRSVPVEAPAASARTRQLERLLAVNRKLGASLAVDEVLRQAMDAAIDLTGAERGFVLVREGDALSIAVARNLDQARVGPEQLEFSRSIAEHAIASGELVMTLDARADERFATHRSVHAMKLRSVIAVPIPSPDGVVGAMYLDNRLLRARFAEVDRELLLAFADQLAIALENARLHEELARRAAQIEALSRGQATRIEQLESELEVRQRALERRYDYGELVADAPAMQPVLATLDRVIDSPLSVLVTGESGTGKELVARAVHFNGPRKEGPFVTVNCAALSDTLLESELFGHVRGAFTGADRNKDGLMVAASGGTLFLDELGETSLAMQAKLLRAIEQREVRPVGGDGSVKVDFRLVCATNRDLREEVEAGRFREDLYYRVGVVEVKLPPLRERLEDLPELCRRILVAAAEDMDRDAPSLSAAALAALSSQPWPGNVRQLQNALRTALVLSDGESLAPEHFAATPRAPRRPPASRAEHERREKARILRSLEATGWNVSASARELSMGRATLYRKLARHGIPTAREREA